MSRNTSISLGDHFGEFIEDQIGQGRYGSASEVVRAGLRLLEEHETRLKVVRQALGGGEGNGLVAPPKLDQLQDGKPRVARKFKGSKTT